MNYYEVKVKYEKTMENGMQKTVSEIYLTDALSFTEAEAIAIEEMSMLCSAEFKIAAIKKVNYAEIIKSESDNDGTWFKCKLTFITIDERTEKEIKTHVSYLVEGNNLESAKVRMAKAMSSTMIDYQFSKIEETPIMDIFYHKVGNSSNDVLANTQSNV